MVAVVGLLGLAAAQPVLRSTIDCRGPNRRARRFFVIDISRSMLASRSPGARTRLARAREDAVRLRDEPGRRSRGRGDDDRPRPAEPAARCPIAAVFEQTVRQAVQVGEPPPAGDAVTATNLGALGALGTQSFFPPSATQAGRDRAHRRRVAAVRPTYDGASARACAGRHADLHPCLGRRRACVRPRAEEPRPPTIRILRAPRHSLRSRRRPAARRSARDSSVPRQAPSGLRSVAGRLALRA